MVTTGCGHAKLLIRMDIEWLPKLVANRPVSAARRWLPKWLPEACDNHLYNHLQGSQIQPLYSTHAVFSISLLL